MRLLVGFVAAVAMVITGCGADAPERVGANTDASAVLRSTFTNLQTLKSATVDLKVTSRGETATATGAFERTDAKALPAFSFRGSARGRSAGAVWTGRDAFATLNGRSYTVPSLLVKQLEAGLSSQATPLPDVSKWVRSPVNAGTADVGGVPTVKITGKADIAQVQADLERFGAPLRMLGTVPTLPAGADASIEVYTGAADSQLRRLVVRAKDGVVNLTLTKVGEEQTIAAPRNPRPFSELQRKLNFK
jgi:hypothetical protein